MSNSTSASSARPTPTAAPLACSESGSVYDLEVWESGVPSTLEPAFGLAPEPRPHHLDLEVVLGAWRPGYRSLTGAATAAPRRDDPAYGFLLPVGQGPLALLVLDDLDDAWALEAPLGAMGWRTTVRLGGDEALHAIHEELPDLVVLAAWGRASEGLTFLRVARRFFPGIEHRLIAVDCGARGEGLHDVLVAEGVVAFIEERSTPAALRALVANLGLNHEADDAAPAPSLLDGLTEALGADHADDLPLMPGTVIGERFVVEKAIGRGATASVYRVRDLLLQVRVALKVLSRGAAMDHALERFRREMLVCRELMHDHVVRTFDFGIHEGQPFYTMELLHGATMDVVAGTAEGRSGPALPIGQRLALMAQAFSGLAAVHKVGVLHRDLKSANVFVVDGGRRAKVVDFGLARFEASRSALSQEGALLGSPSYAAPEVLLDGAPASQASDIYGLGVVAWELICGRLPWSAPDLANLMAALAMQPPPRPRALEPELSRSGEELLLELVTRQPSLRPTSAAKVAERLHQEARKLGWLPDPS